MKFLSQINVNTEYTLPFVDGNNGQVLTTDGQGAVYWGSVSAGATSLDGLTDVEITSPQAGQILNYSVPLGGTVPVWRNITSPYAPIASPTFTGIPAAPTAPTATNTTQIATTAFVKAQGYLSSASSINDLSDVTISTVATGQILQWSGTQWVNATLSTVEYVSKVQHLVKCGVAVTKGQAVYVTSADGTNMIVGLASNATEATSSKVIGLAASTGVINDQIFVVTEGLIAGLNTSTATAGDPVWLGTGGNLIFGLANKPVAPAHLVYLGVVTRVQSNNGEIFVNVQNGFELNELHDVLISSPSTGQLIRRDSDGLWKNWSPNFLTSYTETDPIFSASAAAGITSTNITNWNTAYNDSIRAVAFNTTNGVLTLTQQDAGTLTVDLDGRYLTSFSESDPIFEASAAASITNEDIAAWDTAYGWGNHATAGYLTSFTEADTLATVAARGNISDTKLQIRTAGNTSGGNLQLGPYSDGASKWAYITAQHYNSSTEPEGFTLIGGLAQNGQNAVVIGGNIYESNPATEIQFWTHTASTHSTGGTQRGVINSSGNWGVGTTNPTQKLEVSGGAIIASGFGNRAAGTGKALEIGMDGTSAVLQAYDRTASTYIPININSSAATFNSALYASSIWATNYGPRDSNGNINFVDWSSNVIARINRLSGIASVGNRKLSMGILDINSSGSPEVRINTNIPFALGGADFTVNIKGFQYGSSNMVSLSIGWHYYLSQFYNETAISNGAFSPTITLGVDENNYVVIHLSNVGYWPKLYVESVYSSAYADDYVANWNWVDAGVDGLSNTTTVPYKPLDTSITGNAAYATNAGNSATTSQTNFSTLTVSNNTVATQAWVTSQGYLSGAHTHSASDITSGTLSTDRLPKQELGISIQGNFGQWEPHGTYTNLNTDVAYWGWSFVQGNTNAPHSGSQQWYRGRFSLGDAYGNGSAGGDYWMEIAIPRYNQGSNSGNLFVRTCENGTINGWQGVRAAFATDADTLDGQHGSYYQPASTAITTSNIGSQSVAYAGEAGQLLRFDNRTISPSETSAGYLQFGFTSWTNNNASPYADYLHMRSYTDSSGGSDNLVMFKKSGIGMRIWQQTWGSSTAYSSYADVWTTENFSQSNVNNWDTAYGWGNHADAGYLTNYSYTETDTLATVTSRGGSTGSAVVMYGKVTLGNNSSGTYNGNTNGLTLNSTAEIRSTSVQNPPALTWHYEGLATRHLLMTSAGAMNFVSPSNEASGVAVLQVNGNTVWHAGNLNPSGFAQTSGAEFTGPVIVNVGDVAVDTMAFKVAGPSDYDSLTIGMRGTPDYDSYIASFGNDIHFYSGKGVTTENHSFFWYTSKSGSGQHAVVAMTLDHLQNLTIGGTYTENSSVRYKDNITPLESVSGKVEKLEAVTYTKKGDELVQLGLIAESVSELFPEIVKYDEEGRPDGVSYTRLSVILLKALQEQNAVIAALTERVNKLENK